MRYSVKEAKAGVIEWFELLGPSQDDAIVSAIEHDRKDYSLQKGLVRKLLVIAGPYASGESIAGGAYFFDTSENARRFLDWASHEHRDLDGRTFEERDFVGKRHAHVCEIVGHVECGDSSVIPATVHVERFHIDSDSTHAKIEEFFSQPENFSSAPGLLSVSCLYDPVERTYFLINVGARSTDLPRPALPDLPGLKTFVGQGREHDLPAVKTDDIRFWVYTIWEPRKPSDPVGHAVWPNSPPFPCPSYWLGK